MEMLFGIVYIMVIMDDIYYNILLNLDIVDIGVCGSVDKTFNKVSKLEMLWMKIYFLNFGGYNMNGTYYDMCKRYYCILKLNAKLSSNCGVGYWINTPSIITINVVINEMPTEIGLLKNLKYLSLTKNKMQTIMTEIGLLKNLEKIELVNNCIKIIPTEIGLLQNLKHLNLYSNAIEYIPTELCNANSLVSIFMGKNKIKTIPMSIGLLKNLVSLYLNDNEIDTIPTEILLLSKFNVLSLFGNKISEIPKEFENLHNITIYY